MGQGTRRVVGPLLLRTMVSHDKVRREVGVC